MSGLPDRLSAALADRYRIEREIAEGGMATVFLAEDLRHRRRVALKVLKPDLAAILGDERFEKEIRTTASLQHPHILPLFDSGTADGFLFYVMPYIDGETLRERLDREAQLPVDEAVRIAIDVADALEYAHRSGIIHRDIKPENILLHNGRPMVADFGIALAVSAAVPRQTVSGISLGTPDYMSPEQVTADKAPTARSDIYSLGSVLFEMLAGQRPHRAASSRQLVVKIMTEEAPPVTRFRKTVPRHVEAAISCALQTLPADRFEAAADFAAALRNPAFGASDASTDRPAAATRRVALVTGAALVAAILIGMWGWLRPAPPRSVARYRISLAPGDVNGEAFAGTLALSPDGEYLVFRDPPSGDGRLHVKRRDEETPRPLAGTEGASGPFFSPDGEWIGFFVGREMRKMPTSGGSSLKLADSVTAFYAGGAWLEDGTIIYYSIPALRRLPPSGAPSVIVASPETLGGRLPWLPTPLPGSRGALFTTCVNVGPSTCGDSKVHVYDARRDTVRLVFDNALGAWHAPTGHVLYLTPGGTLFAVPWDNDALAPSGTPVAIMDGVQAPGFVTARDGTALYVIGPPLYDSRPAANAEAVWVDLEGRIEPVDSSWRFNNAGNAGWGLALSPDGTRIAARMLTELGTDIWIKPLPSGPLARLTFDEADDRSPAWSSRDRITYLSDRPVATGERDPGAAFDLWEQAADGTDEPELIRAGDSPSDAFRSPDGRWVILVSRSDTGGAKAGILIHRLAADSAGQSGMATTIVGGRSPALSPDSRWLAYVSTETGTEEVFIRRFPDVSRAEWQISRGGGYSPVWARNGNELYYLRDNVMHVVGVAPGPPVTVGEPRVLFALPDDIRTGSTHGGFAIAPDDQRFLMIRNVAPWDATASGTLVMVQNFFEELKSAERR